MSALNTISFCSTFRRVFFFFFLHFRRDFVSLPRSKPTSLQCRGAQPGRRFWFVSVPGLCGTIFTCSQYYKTPSLFGNISFASILPPTNLCSFRCYNIFWPCKQSWAPEQGHGDISFIQVSGLCQLQSFAETHSVGLSHVIMLCGDTFCWSQ